MLIVNPFAGKARARNMLFELIEKFCQNGFCPSVYLTDAILGAREIVAEYGRKYDVIVCVGGDGTLNQVVSSVVHNGINVPIGYIPSGTANDIANTLDIPHDILGAASEIITSKPIPFDVGTIGERYFVYIASFGIFTSVSYSTPQQQKNILGHFAYVLQGIKSVQNIKSYNMTIESDSGTYSGEYIFGAMTNCISFAGLFKLKKENVILNDGLFEVMLIRRPRTMYELQQTAACFLRKQYNERYITFFHTSRLSITCDEDVSWTTDGEFGGTYSHVILQAKKQAVELLLEHDFLDDNI